MKFVGHHWDFIVFIILAAIFVGFPQADLIVSSWFYRSGEGFFHKGDDWVLFIHHAIPAVARWLSIGLALIFALSWIPRLKALSKLRKPSLYLLVSLALGPGLVVNGVFKDHWGRARPADVQEFGGSKTFTPAFAVANQCERNCSFVSGHAAQGFFFSLLGFLARQRIWFFPGLALGGVVGLARIVQGRHFLSDVVFAFFAVYFVSKLIHYLMFGRARTTAAITNGSTMPRPVWQRIIQQRSRQRSRFAGSLLSRNWNHRAR